MTTQTLEGHLDTQVEIDFCGGCQLFWFDHLESLRLSPGATLQLFTLISEHKTAPPPVREPLKCPRCGMHLLLTNDRQRNTPFRYWRCDREHGRLITFFDFLREKDFIRPLSGAQLAALRQNVQMVNCSNCGAPIDLSTASACAHCGTPISMLDVKQISEMAAQLGQAAAPRAPIDVDSIFAAMRAERERDRDSSSGLVETGLAMMARWLTSG
jgi:hypothetical protein